MHKIYANPEFQVLSDVSSLAEENGFKVWVVGGVIRDALIGQQEQISDVDLVVEGNAATLAKIVARHFNAEVKTFDSFLTAKVMGIPGLEALDLASTRKEIYRSPGLLPEVTPGSFEDDLKRRDFTVNALYVALSEFLSASAETLRMRVCDRVEGISDLDSRLIRVLHQQSFIDDPTRLFRALRYQTRIRGSLESTTAALFSKAISNNGLSTISPQRILAEIGHACEEPLWCEVISAFLGSSLLLESGIVTEESSGDFDKILRTTLPDLKKEIRFEYVCASLFFINEVAKREQMFRKFGFGRKFFKKMKSILDERFEAGENMEFFLKESFQSAGLFFR